MKLISAIKNRYYNILDKITFKRRQDQQIQYMKDKLFRLAVEYARMKLFGAILEDGSWTSYVKPESDSMTKYMLDTLGSYAVNITREMSVIPNEIAALSKKEKEELFKAGRLTVC